MKVPALVVAICCALLLWVGISAPSHAGGEAIEVIATAYTCDSHPNNPMYPCGPLRWGGNVWNPGMACPYWWRDRHFEVPGYGILRCDDTGRYDTWNGLPHIDIRVPTYGQAYRMGLRRMTIYTTSGGGTTTVSRPVQQAAAPAPATEVATVAVEETPQSGAITSPVDAIAAAHALAPRGDDETALAVHLKGARALETFPELLQGTPVVAEHRLWLVSLWVPASRIPEGAVARPNANEPIAARLFVFDGVTRELLSDLYITPAVVEKLGWLPGDRVDYAP